MLKVNLNNSWTAASAEAVVKLMLDGEVDRGTAASDPSVTDGEGPLERFLQPSHFDELAGQILSRIKDLYRSNAWGSDPHLLLERLRDMSTWSWSDDLIRGRLLWITAWLEELTGSTEKAITYYSLYLAGDFPGTVLRALATNNRGVLRVRLGQIDGVFDLAQVAVPDSDLPADEVALPAACFNLLNLLNAAARSDVLSHELRNTMGRYLYRLSREQREQWIGKTEEAKKKEDEDSDEKRSKSTPVSPSNMLRDPKHFNNLACRLAMIAQRIAPPVGMVDPDSFIDQELSLWSGRSRDDVVGSNSPRLTSTSMESHAEAASLLFAGDIPPSLTARNMSAAWPRRLIEEGLVRAENYMERNAFDLAESALKGARAMAMARLKQQTPETEELLKTIDGLSQRLTERHRDFASLRIHEQCVDFDQQVNAFCHLRDYPTAKRQVIDLQNRVAALTKQILEHDDWGGEALSLVEDHVRRADQHLSKLEQNDRSAKVRLPLARLKNLWPHSWDEPVPVSAFEALTQCQALDPSHGIEDWDLIRKKLHDHQAQYYFQRVLRSLELGKIDRLKIQRELELAVRQDPELEASAVPILELLAESLGEEEKADVQELRERLALMREQSSPGNPLGETVVPAPRGEAATELEATTDSDTGTDSVVPTDDSSAETDSVEQRTESIEVTIEDGEASDSMAAASTKNDVIVDVQDADVQDTDGQDEAPQKIETQNDDAQASKPTEPPLESGESGTDMDEDEESK